MSSEPTSLHSWGRYPVTDAVVHVPRSAQDIQYLLQHTDASATGFSGIARGFGRSYGDSALASHIVHTRLLDHFLEFGADTGVLTCAAGVSLDTILHHFTPRGWFLPVVPGTRYVSVGGAIASDVHGKNHHIDGTFGQHLQSLRLLLASGEVVNCSAVENSILFHATCGGMGLTGVILDASIVLRRIPGSAVMQRTLRTQNLQEVIEKFEANVATTYSVAWLDCLANGSALGRSLLFLGEHAADGHYQAPRSGGISVPFSTPSFLLNRYSIGAFNALYHKRPINSEREQRIEAGNYFFPLDSIAHWNRLYGKRGFLQYQFVVPDESAHAAISRVLSTSSAAGKGSFLSVLKKFGPGNDNLLSFPIQGYTLAMDFKWEKSLLPMLDELDRIVLDHGGRLYLAKDARMSEDVFRRSYPRWEEFAQLRTQLGADKAFNSLQSRRLGF
ncbi:MAG: FAD-binding oxidoreductase [Gammaproteobacteria bacterium]|nr:FAD-binding oxidoreductase [Gammaproteobacteria bacterium]MDP2141999.1 FAD-binding oxidoreductase [Gammaproteobacteria bacterium]MDP2348422.1 FAD-binding oxidoreductase [Gammaproteobacteria bacterium]